MKKFSVNFGGFYGSTHEDVVESCLNSYFNDDFDFDKVDYKKIYVEYSKQYLQLLQDYINENYSAFGITLNFDGLYSPTYYNYSTDSIECNMSELDFERIKGIINDEIIAYIDEHSQSHDGFISFYNGYDEVKKDDDILLSYLFNYIIYKANLDDDFDLRMYEDMDCLLNDVNDFYNESTE